MVIDKKSAVSAIFLRYADIPQYLLDILRVYDRNESVALVEEVAIRCHPRLL
jgi:hypothetical protein